MYSYVYVLENIEPDHTKKMKRSEIKRRPLAKTVLDALEPEDKEYRVNYGGSDRIYFVVGPKGNKRWELRYKKSNGSWAWHGLGSYRDVSADKAKEKAQAANQLLSKGTDPIEQKTLLRAAREHAIHNSLQSVAEDWYLKKVNDGRAEKTLQGMRYALDNDIFPAMGKLPIADITRRNCADLQSSIEKRGAHNTAKKVRSWLGQIFGFAIAHGKCENNPASNLLDIAQPPPAETQYPHLMEHELQDFLNELTQTRSGTIVRCAAWLVIYTASRPGMVRHAEWSEFDFSKKLWSISAAKMKMQRDHVIPLSSKVIELLIELKNVTGRSKYLFPSEGSKGKVMSDASINKCFARIGYKGRMTGHGSRHTATTLLSEHGWPINWTEMQLAHKKPGLREVYDKSKHLEKRREMMQWYCDYLDILKIGISPVDKKTFEKRVKSSVGKTTITRESRD